MSSSTSVVVITVDAVLFDMDGTLLDSTPGVLGAWEVFSINYNLGDSTAIAHATHGRRLHDTLKEYCNLTEEARLLQEVDRFEDVVIQGGLMPLPGAIDLISKLHSNPSSEKKWTIVTSASNKYAPRALERSGIVVPLVGMITSNDVQEGKPYPAPYIAGARLCSVDPRNCLVVEDATSGLKAGRAAGARTLAVCTSTSRSAIVNSGVEPDFIASNLTKVSVDVVDDKVRVTIDQSWEEEGGLEDA